MYKWLHNSFLSSFSVELSGALRDCKNKQLSPTYGEKSEEVIDIFLVGGV